MTKASDNAFPSILITEGTEPSAPAAGKQRLYIDSTSHKLKRTNSSGTDTDIEGITNPMSTQGAIIYGGASGTPTALTVGTAGQVLKVNSGATAPEWGAASGLAAGWTPFAGPVGLDNTTTTFAVTRSLAAVSAGNAGAIGALVFVTAPMKLRSISVWNKNTATARAAEGRVYSIGTTANAAFITGTDCAWAFTPSAASLRAATVSGAPVSLDPGYYLVVIRNTSATQTFDVGAETQGASNMLKGSCVHSVTASVAALGSTIDVTGWSRAGSIVGIQLDGEIFGTGAAWDV